jgi:hypothetical protein
MRRGGWEEGEMREMSEMREMREEEACMYKISR